MERSKNFSPLVKCMIKLVLRNVSMKGAPRFSGFQINLPSGIADKRSDCIHRTDSRDRAIVTEIR